MGCTCRTVAEINADQNDSVKSHLHSCAKGRIRNGRSPGRKLVRIQRGVPGEPAAKVNTGVFPGTEQLVIDVVSVDKYGLVIQQKHFFADMEVVLRSVDTDYKMWFDACCCQPSGYAGDGEDGDLLSFSLIQGKNCQAMAHRPE